MRAAELFARNFERCALFAGRHGECRVHRIPDTFDGRPFTARGFSEFVEPYLGTASAFYGGDLEPVAVHESHPTGTKSAYSTMCFESPYQSGFSENDRATFKWFRCAERSRRVVVIVPGWPRQNQKFEEGLAARFRRGGIDVALVTVPFHQGRTPRDAYSGEYFISSNPLWTIENFRQLVAEIRLVIRWLRGRYDTVGLLGLSSGGVHAGLAAYCEDVDFYVPVMSASDLGGLMWASSITSGIRAQMLAKEIDHSDLESYWSIADIARLRGPLRTANVLQIATRFDGIIPLEYQRALWEALGQPDCEVLPTSHFGIVFYGRALADLTAAFIERRCHPASRVAQHLENGAASATNLKETPREQNRAKARQLMDVSSLSRFLTRSSKRSKRRRTSSRVTTRASFVQCRPRNRNYFAALI